MASVSWPGAACWACPCLRYGSGIAVPLTSKSGASLSCRVAVWDWVAVALGGCERVLGWDTSVAAAAVAAARAGVVIWRRGGTFADRGLYPTTVFIDWSIRLMPVR